MLAFGFYFEELPYCNVLSLAVVAGGRCRKRAAVTEHARQPERQPSHIAGRAARRAAVAGIGRRYNTMLHYNTVLAFGFFFKSGIIILCWRVAFFFKSRH